MTDKEHITIEHDDHDLHRSLTFRDMLATHAPPMPDWFWEDNDSIFDLAVATSKWPWHYADMVLAARDE